MISIKISIIVPVYNAEKYLKECLDSLVNQTYENIEIIAIDDASSDNSLKILEEYADKYSQIKVYHNEFNIGQSATRNKGLRESTGDYIGFVDSDDYINLQTIESIVHTIKKENEPDIIQTSISFVDNISYQTNINNPIVDFSFSKNYDNYPHLLFWSSPSVTNKIFKKELISNMTFIENCMWEDIAFAYGAMLKANTITTMPNVFYYYRRQIENSNSVSAKAYRPNPHLFDIFTVCDYLTDAAIKNGRECAIEDVKLIQIAACLQRIEEIQKWQVEDSLKEERISEVYNLMCQKYGNPHDVDLNLLSSKVDLNLIDQLDNSLKK